MSQKQPKPTLSGQRIRTRKRDEKEKLNPLGFRDAIIAGLAEAGNDLEQVAAFLDSAGGKQNYRQYGEQLFDILLAGGILAPGGSIIEDGGEKHGFRTTFCVFEANEDSLKGHVQVINKLVARYRYLQKSFEDEMNKILLFLKAFSEDQRNKLAIVTGIILANGMTAATILTSLLNESLVKEGISLTFVTKVFQIWLKERDIANISTVLKRAELNGKLPEFFPPSKKSQENICKHFTAHGLEKLVDFQKQHEIAVTRREFQHHLKEMIDQETSVKEMIASAKDEMKKAELQESEVVNMIWKMIMASVEWNKKEELVADQALRHLKNYASLFEAFATQEGSEMSLLLKIEEHCYANMNFMKVFKKIVLLFYNTDVLSEDTIIKWYRGEQQGPKSKKVFVEQMKKMVEWLQTAQEESSNDDEEEN